MEHCFFRYARKKKKQGKREKQDNTWFVELWSILFLDKDIW